MLQWVDNAPDFSSVLNASIAASWMILAVIVLRLLLNKAPKKIHVALWGLVALRLIMPFSIKSSLSLVPSAETIPREMLRYEGTQLHETAHINIVSNPVFPDSMTLDTGSSVGGLQIDLMLFTLVWLAGAALLDGAFFSGCTASFRKWGYTRLNGLTCGQYGGDLLNSHIFDACRIGKPTFDPSAFR